MSIGAAAHPADGRTATELIAAADRGLYEVKRVGGRRAQIARSEQAPDADGGDEDSNAA
jgi:predicted signal transduction protein with EAL and GGDEF domain